MTTRLALILGLPLSGPVIAVAQVRLSTETYGPVALGDQPDWWWSRRHTRRQRTCPRKAGSEPSRASASAPRPGGLLYQQTLDTKLVVVEGFEGETSVGSARELRGKTRRFLLLTLNYVPSAPSSGTDFLIYGFDRRGRFRHFGPALGHPGTEIKNRVDASGTVVLLREGKYLDMSEWTGSFVLILPWEF